MISMSQACNVDDRAPLSITPALVASTPSSGKLTHSRQPMDVTPHEPRRYRRRPPKRTIPLPSALPAPLRGRACRPVEAASGP